MPTCDFFSRFGLFAEKSFFDAKLCARLRSEMRSQEGARAGVWTKEGYYEVDERERLAELAHVGAPTISLVEAGLSAIRPRIESHFNRALAECQMPQFLIYREGSYIRPHRDR